MTEFTSVILIGLAMVFAAGTVAVCLLGAILDGKTQRRADMVRQAEAGLRMTPASRKNAEIRSFASQGIAAE